MDGNRRDLKYLRFLFMGPLFPQSPCGGGCSRYYSPKRNGGNQRSWLTGYVLVILTFGRRTRLLEIYDVLE